jgi:ABC-type Fe3+ transport system substrate-binding protein
MVNRQVLPDPKDWPTSIEDFADPRFKGKFAIATVNEETTVSQVSSIRLAKGDAYAYGLVKRLLENGLKRYAHNGLVRESLPEEGNAAAMVNSSNCNVFLMAGKPIGEAWIDQETGGLGTHIEAHTIAVFKGAKHPEAARDFIDFILGVEVQTLLARMYGETPVNPKAVHGTVRPLAEIRKTDAPMDRVTALRDETKAWLVDHGFAPPPDYVPPD